MTCKFLILVIVNILIFILCSQNAIHRYNGGISARSTRVVSQSIANLPIGYRRLAFGSAPSSSPSPSSLSSSLPSSSAEADDITNDTNLQGLIDLLNPAILAFQRGTITNADLIGDVDMTKTMVEHDNELKIGETFGLDTEINDRINIINSEFENMSKCPNYLSGT
jgi:hypothetical protein